MKDKKRTYAQVEAAQRRAISAAENLTQDDDLADEIESLSVEEYAERKGFEIVENPHKKGGGIMSRIQQLESELENANNRITELEEEREDVLSALGMEVVEEDDEDDEDDDEDA